MKNIRTKTSASAKRGDNMATTEHAEKEINFYDELSLDKNKSTDEIRKRLNDLKRKWGERAGLSGQNGQNAQAQIKKINEAEKIFQDETTRAAYDARLNKTPKETNEEINWISRAWNYIFIDEQGAASVAARNARNSKPNDARSYVVSAWVEIIKDEYKLAKEYTDEAFVYNEDEGNIFDIQYLRGVTFSALENHKKAIESFDAALEYASIKIKPEIFSEQANSYRNIEDYVNSIKAVLRGLDSDPEANKNTLGTLQLEGLKTLEKVANEENRKSKDDIAKILSDIKSETPGNNHKETLQEYAELIQRWITLSKEEEPRDPLPNFPFFQIIGACLFFLVFTIFQNVVLFFLWAIPACLAAYRIYSRTQVKQRRKEYSDIQNSIRNIENRMKEIVDSTNSLISSK